MIAFANGPDINDAAKFCRFEQLIVGLECMHHELTQEYRKQLWSHVKVGIPSLGFRTVASYDPTGRG